MRQESFYPVDKDLSWKSAYIVTLPYEHVLFILVRTEMILLRIFKQLMVFSAVILVATQPLAASAASFKTIRNPGGGTIVYGPLSGQLSYQAALSETLKQVEADYGDKPEMGNLLQSRTGSFWEGFFSLTNKDHGGAKMTGLVIVYAPPTGTAGGATLIDTADNFPKSLKSMFQLLVQQVTSGAKGTTASGSSGASAASTPAVVSNVKSAPAAQLTAVNFPDGSARIGLPQGWVVAHAQQGDVAAKGPSGEMLRFGLRIPAVNASGGRGGNLMAIPYNSDPATVFTQLFTQAAQRQRIQPPTINITNTQNLGPQNFFIYADIDKHDGQGQQSVIAHVVKSPMMMNEFQVTISDIAGPVQVMTQESATIAEIFSSYSLNNQQMLAITNSQIQQGLMQEKATIGMVQQSMESSDRMAQGMSDYLRGESVFVDNDTGTRYRGPDDLATALSNANPNRFQTVPLSQYIPGVDF
ncbi:MAG TPA: hypothetical protein VEJ46_05570 [Candidatus Acidoferrum sp.]|nr:hypothetical protein [Candidatus Acidoferrum sp.]